MTSLLLVPFPPPGHTEPMTALAARLREDGHTVTVFAESGTTRWGLRRPLPPQMYASADGAALYRHLFFGDIVAMTSDIVDLADECGAELIVADVLMPGGGLAAELAGLPWVSLSCAPVPVLDSFRLFIPDHAVPSFAPRSTRESLGLPAGDERNLLGRTSGRLHLIPATPRFSGFPELPAHVALVGPLAAVPDLHADRPPAARPVVAVTSSSNPMAWLTLVQDRYLSAVRQALAGLEVTGLIAHEAAGRPPPNVRFLGRTPHDALFDRCDAVVTHAGWGTVSRALLRGLPLVLVPFYGDQPYIAARCADLGAGIVLPADTVTAAQLRDAIRAVIEEPGYRKAAGELADELRAAAPLATASSMITSLRVLEG
jgi:UDP:flavonoid glycosyltransferase YjiC (YdhE family)